MTREEAIDIIKCLAWHTRPNEEEIIEQAIKALEQELNEDCISRQAVEQIIKSIIADYEWQYDALLDRVKSLPSLRQKSEKIKEYDGICTSYQCKCGQYVQKWFKFCPNCGADMRGEENVKND